MNERLRQEEIGRWSPRPSWPCQLLPDDKVKIEAFMPSTASDTDKECEDNLHLGGNVQNWKDVIVIEIPGG